MSAKSLLYERDFFAWRRQQAELLRAGKLADADIDHIAEEIDSMGRTEKRELVSRLSVFLLHLLKWRFQPKSADQLGGEHPRATKSSRRPPGRQSESRAPFAEGARLGLSRRFAGGGRGDGPAGIDLSRGLSVDGR
jgi:Domain of unknown function DUF29